MITGRQIVCLSSVPWGFLPTSRHHLARLFAEENEVLFVDPPGNALRVGRDESVQSGRLVARARWGRLYRESESLHRLAPARRLPYGGRVRFRVATPINQRAYAWSVGRASGHLGFRHPVLWDVTMVYLAPKVAAVLQPSVHLVHMTDDLWSYDWYRAELDTFLEQSLSTANLAVGSTPEIAGRLATFGVDTVVIGHGVDVERFAPAVQGALGCPPALRSLERPLVGFAGNIESRVDLLLVERLARGAGTVVLVGPVSLARSERTRLEDVGVCFTGPVSYEDLPAHLGALDVGIVPYLLTPLVLRSRPLKMLEMLAAGVPVVTTDMPAARELEPAVQVAGSHDDFEGAVHRAAAEGTAGQAARLGVAAVNSWRQRAEELSDAIAGCTAAGADF